MSKTPLVLLALLVSFASLAPAVAEEDAVARLRAIYAPYLARPSATADVPDQLDPALYSARRRAQIAALQKACEGREMCGPDFDHLIDGQDWELSGLKIRRLSGDDRRTDVDVAFRNAGTPQHFVFTMVKENGVWLIDEMKGGSRTYRYDLDAVLKPNP